MAGAARKATMSDWAEGSVSADPGYWQSDKTQDAPSNFSTGAESWADVFKYGFARAIDAHFTQVDPMQNTKPEVKSLNVPQDRFAGVFGDAEGVAMPRWVLIAGALVVAFVVLPKLLK